VILAGATVFTAMAAFPPAAKFVRDSDDSLPTESSNSAWQHFTKLEHKTGADI